MTTDSTVSSGQTFKFVYDSTASEPSTLTVNDIADFAGTISGFDMGGATDDTLVFNTGTNFTYQEFTPNADGSGGLLIFSNGSAQTSAGLVGDYDPGKFHAAVSGSQTTITYG